MRNAGVEEGCPNLKSFQAQGPEFLRLWQSGSPSLPQGVAAEHSRPVGFHALAALVLDTRPPSESRLGIRKCFEVDGRLPENVEVVHFTQNILQLFEIVAPRPVQARQEILHDISKTFYSDAQLMKLNFGAVAQRLAMKSGSLVPSFQA